MALSVTLSTLRSLVRRRTDQVDSAQVTDSELDGWINQGMRHYVRILISANPDFYVLEDFISTASGIYEYSLNTDFLLVRGVDRLMGNDRRSLKGFTWVDRNKYRQTNTDYPRYRILRGGRDGTGVRLQFASNPGTTSNGYLVHYCGVPADLVNTTDVLDDVLGLSDYVVIYAAACVREMLDEHASAAGLRAEMQQMEAAITRLGTMRQADGSVVVGMSAHHFDDDDEERYRWPT